MNEGERDDVPPLHAVNVCGCINLCLCWCVQTIDKTYIINAFSFCLLYIRNRFSFFSFLFLLSLFVHPLPFRFASWAPVLMMTLWQIWIAIFIPMHSMFNVYCLRTHGRNPIHNNKMGIGDGRDEISVQGCKRSLIHIRIGILSQWNRWN